MTLMNEGFGGDVLSTQGRDADCRDEEERMHPGMRLVLAGGYMLVFTLHTTQGQKRRTTTIES